MDYLDSLLNKERPFSVGDIKLFSEGGADPGTNPDPVQPPDPKVDPPAGSDPKASPAPAMDPDPKEGKIFDEEYVKGLRAENAKYRTNAKQFADKSDKLENQIKSIQKALGLEDEEPDVDKLQSELKANKDELRSLKIENAFSKVARKAGADEDLTYAVLHKQGKFSDLLLDDTLTGSIEKLVETALKENPKLKADSGSINPTGDPDPQPGRGPKSSFNDMIRKAAGISL